MKNKYIKAIVIIYFAVLVAGSMLYYIVPKENFMKATSTKKMRELENREKAMMEYIAKLPSKKQEGEHKIESYEFNYEGKELDIALSKEAEEILLERKSTNDNKIEVYRYATPRFFEGGDFSGIIKEPSIQLVNKSLIAEAQKQEVSCVEFPKDFTITQFYRKETEKDFIGYGELGRTIIYIKIPKDLTILKDERYHYIKK